MPIRSAWYDGSEEVTEGIADASWIGRLMTMIAADGRKHVVPGFRIVAPSVGPWRLRAISWTSPLACVCRRKRIARAMTASDSPPVLAFPTAGEVI